MPDARGEPLPPNILPPSASEIADFRLLAALGWLYTYLEEDSAAAGSRPLDVPVVVPRTEPPPAPRLAERLQAIPFFYRVLLGNCLVVVLGAGMGTYLTASFSRVEPQSSPLWLVLTFMIVGTGLSLLVNYVILKAAFLPLEALGRTVLEVRRATWAPARPPGWCVILCCRSSRRR